MKCSCNRQACLKLDGMNTFHTYPHGSVCFCITIVRDGEGHALSTPLLPEGHESGLRNLSDDRGQVFLAVASVPWRRALGVSSSTITAPDHGLTLEESGSLV